MYLSNIQTKLSKLIWLKISLMYCKFNVNFKEYYNILLLSTSAWVYKMMNLNKSNKYENSKVL